MAKLNVEDVIRHIISFREDSRVMAHGDYIT
jgi:hypothetical protein